MDKRNIGENFNLVISTKKTLLGASATDFKVAYANVNALKDRTLIAGGATEAIKTIITAHTATATASALAGAKKIHVDSATSTLEVGDTLEYSSGLFTYIQSIVADKVYVRTPLKVSIATSSTLTQVGNMGEYATEEFSFAQEGEYLVTLENPNAGVFVEKRIKVVAIGTSDTDPDAPIETIAVAH